MEALALCEIGNRLLAIRKRIGMTQAEVAERSGLSDRAYANIERGKVNVRVETILRVCQALRITPNDILIDQSAVASVDEEELLHRLADCAPRDKETAMTLLAVYLQSLR